jgi:hypothetical protein
VKHKYGKNKKEFRNFRRFFTEIEKEVRKRRAPNSDINAYIFKVLKEALGSSFKLVLPN